MIKKYFKELISISFVIIMAAWMPVTAFAPAIKLETTAFAAKSETQNISILKELAKEHISVTVTGSETNYSNIENFYSAARQKLPNISDLDLAKTVLEYTRQDYSNLSDETILETLDFLEITSTNQFFRAKTDGSVEEVSLKEVQTALDNPITPLADWLSNDGYMQITTNAYKESKTDYGTPFILTATAAWLKYPAFRFTDTLAIVYDGVFDDSYTVYSTFNETGKCSKCKKIFSWNETESYGSTSSNNEPHFIRKSNRIELDFSQSQAIGTKLDLKIISCLHPANGTAVNFANTTGISAYIRFRILCNSTTEAGAAYAHAKLAGEISISGTVGSNGVSPSFNSTISKSMTRYSAAPVTLRCK